MAEAPPRVAAVHLGNDYVGQLQQVKGTTIFRVEASYWEMARRPVLGQTFEERRPQAIRQGSGRLPQWFSNLLPEEGMRERIAAQHGFNQRNEFRLLLALGSDLPGAVRVVANDNQIHSQHLGELEEGSDMTPSYDSPELETLIKFSIAGVQLKLSMVMSGGSLTLAGRGELGDRIVKLPRGQYIGVPENEFAMMRWAGASGITVPTVELCPASQLGKLPAGFEPVANAPIYVVKRFDRQSDGSVVHMEDLNQVVGHWPEHKYSGLSFERLGLLIFRLCGSEDFVEFIRRLVFCIAIGNEDAHLKNWSLLYPDRINPRLSPAYDLVSTVQYEELDRGMALKLGGSKDPRGVSKDKIERMAASIGFSEGQAGQVVDETLERMRASWDELEGDLPIGSDFVEKLHRYQWTIPMLRPLTTS